jgi:hypothetical protein
MTDLELLIQTAESLCNRLSDMANQEVQFGWRVCSMMEQVSWEISKQAEDLKAINNFVGGIL